MATRSLQPFIDALEILRFARNVTLSEAIVFATAAEGSGRITLEELADRAELSIDETERILADFSEHGMDSAPGTGLIVKAARLPAGGPSILSLTQRGEKIYDSLISALSGNLPDDGPTER